MYGQQPAGEGIEWRDKSEENSCQSRIEANQMRETETVRSAFVLSSPSPRVEQTNYQRWKQQPWIEIPGTKDGICDSFHRSIASAWLSLFDLIYQHGQIEQRQVNDGRVQELFSR